MSKSLPRRNFLSKLSLAVVSAVAAPVHAFSHSIRNLEQNNQAPMNPIKNMKPLGFQWETADPFLFCVHHEDYFPKGNAEMGPPETALKGRHIGDDFIIKDGFRMYHGQTVPGFPGHPHRGFETITVVRKGIVDHADSMGAAGRYGNGDVQWMTAGKGVQHSEMFPLIHADKENTMELFQIWLNLPARNKMVDPHFKMMWSDMIPKFEHNGPHHHKTVVEVIAGELGKVKAPAPPPDSWASDATHEVGIWNIKMESGASWELPKASDGINRILFFYEGKGLKINGTEIPSYHSIEVEANVSLSIEASETETSILVLQGKPIAEPVMQYGPFVMNTKEEIHQAFEDYHRTQFGGWPWPRYDQVHPRNKSRFARHADGKEEVKEG